MVSLTPHNWPHADQVAPTNKLYRAMAKRQGASYIECMQDVEPWSSAHYDGLHFTAEGQELLAACLRRGVDKLLR